jgi:CRP-like cAMP-binding protein
MDFKENLQTYYHLSDDELKETMRRFEPLVLPAKTHLVEKGAVADRIGYLRSGLLRSYFYDDLANDITTHFFKKGTVVISMESFNRQVPSNEYIVTLEKSELLVISYAKMMELFELVPVWRQIAKDVDEMKFNDLMNRSIQLQTLTARERYQLFCETHREVLQKVALRHVASYLGIDIATLSRIRKST